MQTQQPVDVTQQNPKGTDRRPPNSRPPSGEPDAVKAARPVREGAVGSPGSSRNWPPTSSFLHEGSATVPAVGSSAGPLHFPPARCRGRLPLLCSGALSWPAARDIRRAGSHRWSPPSGSRTRGRPLGGLLRCRRLLTGSRRRPALLCHSMTRVAAEPTSPCVSGRPQLSKSIVAL